MRKILITVGYKQRELSYVSILVAVLQKAGFVVRVRYANFEVYHEIFSWQPNYILLGQVNQNENIAVAQYAAQCGVKVVVLNCEGIYNSHELVVRFGSNISSYVSVLLAWGKQHAIDAVKTTGLPAKRIIITGTPKFDIYKKTFSNFFLKSKPKISQLQSSKPVICISTSLTIADSPWSQVAHNVVYKEKGRASFEERTARQRLLRDEFIALAKNLSETKKFILLFRPHPLESTAYYIQAFKDHKNVVINNTLLPLHLFSYISLLIHRSSTLATEAWMHSIPTATFDPIDNIDKNVFDFTAIEPIFSTKEAVINWVVDENYKQKNNANAIKKFLTNWYDFDMNNAELSASKILAVFKKLKPAKPKPQLHSFVLIFYILTLFRFILGKNYVYEVIAMFKGKDYLKNMQELYITDAEVVAQVRPLQKLLK